MSVTVDGMSVWVSSPADVVLRKLLWSTIADNESEKQWRDVVGVLAANLDTLDLDDLRDTAVEIGVLDLLEEALAEVAAE